MILLKVNILKYNVFICIYVITLESVNEPIVTKNLTIQYQKLGLIFPT